LVVVACGSTPTDARTGDAPSPRDEEGDAGAASGPQPSSPNKPSPSSNGAGGAASDETGSDDEGVAAQNAAGAPGTTEPMSSRARRPTRVVVKGGSMLGNTRDLYAMNLDGSDAVRFRGLDSLYSVAPRGDRVMLSGSRAANEG